MLKIRCNPALTCLMVIGLHAGSISMNIARAYDGDIDYSAPYVTLDPKTGKLITVDPKQQQADGQAQPPHPNAPPQDATASGPAPATSATTAAAAPANAASPASTSVPTASASGTNVIAAVVGLVLIAGVVAILRRKPATEKNDS